MFIQNITRVIADQEILANQCPQFSLYLKLCDGDDDNGDDDDGGDCDDDDDDGGDCYNDDDCYDDDDCNDLW